MKKALGGTFFLLGISDDGHQRRARDHALLLIQLQSEHR